MNTRIEEIIQKYEGTEDPAMKWELIKMEIRSSTICFSKKNAIKNKENIKNLIQKHTELEREIADNPNDTVLEEYNKVKSEIEYYNNEKSMGAMVRSKADWTEFGEKNTKYFLNLEKRNYKNKCITKLIDENGSEINNSEKILEYEAEYYKKLYTLPAMNNTYNKPNIKLDFLEDTTPKINQEHMELCDQQLDIEDIGIALKELQNGKSPWNRWLHS
jgi:hypothetical protein